MSPMHAYHERSKHHPHRFAPGPGRLDWANQPDPFRRFEGAPAVELPLLEGELPARWDELFVPGAIPVQPLTLETLAHLLELSLGLADWKSFGGHRWALRCNPSSGNLHPTEGYVLAPELPGLTAGVYHYQPRDHLLERRAAASLDWSGGVLVALTGIHWREAWKYGMRAFRYCQHDCGHAPAALAYAAGALGWPIRRLDGGDEEIAAATGIHRAGDFPSGDGEAPEAAVWVGPGEPPAAPEVARALAGSSWQGRANVLSPEHREWADIAAVAAATRKPSGTTPEPVPRPALPALGPASGRPVSRLVRGRRSAQAFDGVSGMDAARFWRLLDALLPRDLPPWSLVPESPQVHPVLFVHRVEGLEPGVYCLPRGEEAVRDLRAALAGDWQWQRPAGCPDHLPLYLLAPGDARAFAATASCQQDIAADSAFSLAMLARFDDITDDEQWRYRHRFWEAGVLGQALYLEAEAAGVQGTGIGCYFDDTVHEALGVDTARYQDLYHFTVGTAVPDARLESSLPYVHLRHRPTHAVP